jgi:toxin-antitoxin system PIN domain toxin
VILPDVNVLVSAFRVESEGHEQYRRWLTRLVAGADVLALHDAVLAGFLRVVTNARIITPPAPTPLAVAFLERLTGARRVHWLPSAPSTWTHLAELVADDRAIAANLVPDAHLAAVCLAHGAALATADRGFARYPGLRWFDPIRS